MGTHELQKQCPTTKPCHTQGSFFASGKTSLTKVGGIQNWSIHLSLAILNESGQGTLPLTKKTILKISLPIRITMTLPDELVDPVPQA